MKACLLRKHSVTTAFDQFTSGTVLKSKTKTKPKTTKRVKLCRMLSSSSFHL